MKLAIILSVAAALSGVLVAGVVMSRTTPQACVQPLVWHTSVSEPWKESYTSMQALWDRCGAQGGVFTWQWLPDQLEVHAGCIGGVR